MRAIANASLNNLVGFKGKLVSDLKFVQALWVCFEDVLRRLGRHIEGSPALRQTGINYLPIFIQPDHRQIEINKKHVDSAVHPALTGLNQDQARILANLPAEHEPAEAQEKGVAVSGLQDLA